ncbi:unnamed protein product [Phytophthora fragariaefolia]|uniref:Unnamed protein product n=1 Tax=Phytophthora fragariaefolia TaxID=1490495 RepID=A0A9W6YBX1_9STRA|nr:unnamed protein product [Phytophthora fragariaefolia]
MEKSPSPSAIEKVPSVGDQLAILAQQLLLRTQVLAAEHTVLQHQQQGQSDAQNAVLMAMQALTETSVNIISEQQAIIVEKHGEALTATHAGRLEMLATKVVDELEKIMAHVQQLVEAKFVAYQNQMGLGQKTDQLVQQQVEAASEGVKAAIQISLEKDIHRACEAIRQALLQSVSRAEEPLRESACALACVRIRKQCRLHDAELEATIAGIVQKEVGQRLNAVQSERALAPADASEQETTLPIDPDETRRIIDRNIQSTVEVICNFIKDEVRAMAPKVEQPQTQQSPVNENIGTHEYYDVTNDDYQLERRMQKAWRRTYINDSYPASQRTSSSADQEVCSGPTLPHKEHLLALTKKCAAGSTSPRKEHLLALIERCATEPTSPRKEHLLTLTESLDQPMCSEVHPVLQRGSRIEDEPLRLVVNEEQTLLEPAHEAVVLQEISTQEQDDSVLTRPNAQENTQQQHISQHHQEDVRVNLRAVISEIQLQVAVRAETAARRYLSSKKKSRKK